MNVIRRETPIADAGLARVKGFRFPRGRLRCEAALASGVPPAVGQRSWLRGWRVGFLICGALVPALVVVWALGGASALRAAFRSASGETLVVDASTKSFAVVSEGDPVTVSYKLTNLGSANVRIVGCRAACRCLVPVELPFSLGPGESRDFPISIRDLRRGETGPVERINWSIVLYTTNPAQVEIPLRVIGEIQRSTRSVPAS